MQGLSQFYPPPNYPAAAVPYYLLTNPQQPPQTLPHQPMNTENSSMKMVVKPEDCANANALQRDEDAKLAFDYPTGSGVMFSVWEHEGSHETHEQPPGGTLSASEWEQVDDQVLHHQTTTAHQLHTGDPGPDSVPLADILPILANPKAAHYQLSQSQAHLGIQSAPSSKGSLAFLYSFAVLCQKLTTPFIIDSSLNGRVYFTLQSLFMDALIKEAVDRWLADFAEGPEAGRHGFVTDGDHSFFRHGPLLASCMFSIVANGWAPVLYTWIDQQDIAHHRPHFWCLFNTVIKHAGVKFHRQLLLKVNDITFSSRSPAHSSPVKVMDFSSAQQAAHAEEYADAVITTISEFSMLSKQGQDSERKRLVEEAQEMQVGCEIHFGRSVTCIKKNGALVPPELIDTFDSGIRRLLLRNTSSDLFNETVTMLKTTFPRIVGWVNWWLR
ncbi:hypothetical protein C8J57DRAFT_1262469 [Mycena rebaudengoi]|nr:hypothetical protein C8J57DRAFT_1262469 [Mycena rebaudengoi]